MLGEEKNLYFDYGKSYVTNSEINNLESKNFPEEEKWRAGAWLNTAILPDELNKYKNINKYDNMSIPGSMPANGTDIVIPLAGHTGWLNKISNTVKPTESELAALEKAAAESAGSGALLVAASGNMYTAAKAGVSFLRHRFKSAAPEIIFIGCNTSAAYHRDVFEKLRERDFSLCAAAGDELEPAAKAAFDEAKALLKKKYGDSYADKISVFTHNTESEIAREAKGISARLFIMNAGFKKAWTVLSPAALFPLAVCGADIRTILSGADIAYMPDEAIFVPVNCADGGICKEDYIPLSSLNIKYYSAVRNLLSGKGCKSEIFAFSDTRFRGIAEWIKTAVMNINNGKIYPDTLELMNNFDDLMACIEGGTRDFFVTFLSFDDYKKDDEEDMDYQNKAVIKRAMQKLRPTKINVLEAEVPEASEFYYGQIISFFLRSAMLTDVWQ